VRLNKRVEARVNVQEAKGALTPHCRGQHGHSCLAAPGGAAGGGLRTKVGTAEESSLAAAESSSSFSNSRDFLILHFDKSAGGTASALLCGLVVGGNIEGDEEEKVGAEDGHASEGGEFFTSTVTLVGEPREIAAGEVGVGSKVDESEVDNELNDLHHGDVLFPPDADTTSRLEVVPVHDDVNTEVEDNGNP